MRRSLAVAIISLSTFAFAAGDADSPSRLRLSQYARTTWTGLNNLPENAVRGLSMTREGAVIIGTEKGAFRFDGVHFTPLPWDRERHGSGASAVLANGDDVWVGTERALLRIAKSETTVWPLPEDCSGANLLSLTSQGTPWVGCLRGGVVRLSGEGLVKVETPGVSRGLHHADDGTMWLASDEGLVAYREDGTIIRTWTEADGLRGRDVQSVCKRSAGGVWAGTSHGFLAVDARGDVHRAGMDGRAVGALIERSDGTV